MDFVKTYAKLFSEAGIKNFSLHDHTRRQEIGLMKKVMSEEKKALRPDLIEYDRNNVSPHFTPEMIRYIESRQPGLSERDHAKLDNIEWFILNLNTGRFTSLTIPGLRTYAQLENCYIKRFNEKPYLTMKKEFMDYVPPDFPTDQIGRYHGEALRLTSPVGEHFYPIYYNGDLPAWRKRLDDNAAFFKTLIGRFKHGKFAVSDGRQIPFADLDVTWATREDRPSDF